MVKSGHPSLSSEQPLYVDTLLSAAQRFERAAEGLGEQPGLKDLALGLRQLARATESRFRNLEDRLSSVERCLQNMS